jgi:hypothetical protein
MDIASTALTGAWLAAVTRVQSHSTLERVAREDRTLTDVIESALRHGGLDSRDPQWVDPNRPAHRLDRRV